MLGRSLKSLACLLLVLPHVAACSGSETTGAAGASATREAETGRGDNEQLVRQYFETMTGLGNSAGLSGFFSEDVVWHAPKSSRILPNPRVGHAAVMDLIRTAVDYYEPGSFRVDLQRVISDEDYVVAQFTMTASLEGGSDYTNDYVYVFSLSNGKIDSVYAYLDTLYMARLAERS